MRIVAEECERLVEPRQKTLEITKSFQWTIFQRKESLVQNSFFGEEGYES